ncbi:MAG: hypothetical protein JWM41_195 [Gemmatimonadetes bacterium]|nr:hypothetical protein [Gemmatimonadota bacterium]
MHDVDRTLQETESEFGETEMHESAGEGEEFLGDIVGGLFGGELEAQEQGFLGEEEVFEQNFLGEQEFEQGFLGESEAVFDEVTEMELAAELLGAQNEEELEQFIGNLLKKAGKFAGNIARGPIGQALGPILKKAARVALPAAGAALGNLVLPGVGGALGGKLASAAGSMFGLEFEGLSPQDREFEAAKRVVRFGGAAAKRLARTPTSVPPRQAIKAATIAAARRHIPGLLRPKIVNNITNVLRQAQVQAARARAAGGRPINRTRGGTYGVGASYGVGPTYVGLPTYGGAPTYAGPAFGAGYVTPSIDTPSYITGSTNGGSYYAPTGSTRTGKWYRRGHKIVLVGV